jgi:hypothetical protein
LSGLVGGDHQGTAQAHKPILQQLFMIDHEDFSVVVKNRASSPKPWQWEIYRAGRNSAIERSKVFFVTATEANRAGNLALHLLLSEYPE